MDETQATPSEQGPRAPSEQVQQAQVSPPALSEAEMKKIRDQVRAELSSEFGKKLSEREAQTQQQYRQYLAQAVREAETRLAQRFANFVPEEEMQGFIKARQETDNQMLLEELQALRQEKATRETYDQVYRELYDAGIDPRSIPPEVWGASPEGFQGRLAGHLAKEVKKAATEYEEKLRAREKALREEIEAEMGLPKVHGASPSTRGKVAPKQLLDAINQAYLRGDFKRVQELRDEYARQIGTE